MIIYGRTDGLVFVIIGNFRQLKVLTHHCYSLAPGKYRKSEIKWKKSQYYSLARCGLLLSD